MYVFARAGPEKAVQPRMLKLQANLSPNWSYDKIVIEVRSGRMGKYLALIHGAHTPCMTSSQIFSHLALPLSQ